MPEEVKLDTVYKFCQNCRHCHNNGLLTTSAISNRKCTNCFECVPDGMLPYVDPKRLAIELEVRKQLLSEIQPIIDKYRGESGAVKVRRAIQEVVDIVRPKFFPPKD